MQLLPRPSSKAISTARDDRLDPTLPVILEYQSPSTAIINMPMPRIARGFTLTFSSMIAVLFIAAASIKVDRVVTAHGVVVARAPTIVVQPLETAIVRSIDVHPGDVVHAGQILARLDPTFAAADMGALVAQVSTLQAQVSRMQAEMENRPFTYSGLGSEHGAAGGDLRAAPGGVQLQAGELPAEGRQPVGDDRPRTRRHRQLQRPAGLRQDRWSRCARNWST